MIDKWKRRSFRFRKQVTRPENGTMDIAERRCSDQPDYEYVRSESVRICRGQIIHAADVLFAETRENFKKMSKTIINARSAFLRPLL